MPEHVENYVDLFSGITGREVTKEDLIVMSERVYNFQRVFNLRMGFGTAPARRDPLPLGRAGDRRGIREPRRALRQAVAREGRHRSDRHDHPGRRSPRCAAYREDQYQSLIDAVYKRRGWTPDGVPTLETLRKLEIDFPEVVEVVKANL